MSDVVGAHNDLHSEHGAVRGEHPGRSRNPVIKVADLAWLEFDKPDLDRAQTELKRREALIPAGAVSGDELTAARNRVDQAQAALASAQAARTAGSGSFRMAARLEMACGSPSASGMALRRHRPDSNPIASTVPLPRAAPRFVQRPPFTPGPRCLQARPMPR